MAQNGGAFARTYSIYPLQDRIVKAIAKQRFEGNESFALRHIVDYYAREHGITPIPDPKRENVRAADHS